MLSELMVAHHECDLFRLSDEEFARALADYPELQEDPAENIKYFKNSATAYIEPKKDCYFDNDTLLKQFRRFFILLKYKTAFTDHKFEVLVDNSTTNATKIYDITKLSKSPGTKCIYEAIEWEKNGVKKRFNFILCLKKYVLF